MSRKTFVIENPSLVSVAKVAGPLNTNKNLNRKDLEDLKALCFEVLAVFAVCISAHEFRET